MIYSNERKLSLSAWLKNNSLTEYENSLKLQKFLFFYESFSKVDGENADFDHLRGYIHGPVFSNVWGDYTKERKDFEKVAEKSLKDNKYRINIKRAMSCRLLVSTLSEEELSELTHTMNVWNAKKERILSGEHQVPLDENDFNNDDYNIIKSLEQIYTPILASNSTVISIDNKYFVISKAEASQLTEVHFDILSTLSKDADLHNPVFVEIDEEGRLIID